MINHYRQDVTAYFKEQNNEYINLSYSGFTCVIPKERMEPTTYHVGLLITKRGKSKAMQYTDKRIDLTDTKD